MRTYALVVSVGILVSLGLSCCAATPVRNKFTGTSFGLRSELPILVPDTGKIDSSSLKAQKADKFLSLWFIYVLTGKVIVSDQPSTILIPLNSRLPRDPTILADKDLVKQILLNHVVLGDIVVMDAAEPTGDIYYSLADSELVFTKEGDVVSVNGVRLTGEQFDFGNVRIYVVEDVIPFLEPQFFDILSDFPEIAEISSSSKNSSRSDNVNVVNETRKKVVRTAKEPKSDVDILPEESDVEISPEVVKAAPIVPKNTMRPTRFEKFRKVSSKNDKGKIEKKNRTTKFPQRSTKAVDVTTTTPSVVEEEVTAPILEVTGSDLEFFGEFLMESPLVGVDLTFFDSLMTELDFPNSRASEFVHHFRKNNLEQFLQPDVNYTAIIPTNGAFYSYYPIDWGFNPFLVENFTKDALLNHFMEGDIQLQNFNDSVEIETIAGRLIKITKDLDGKLMVNGKIIPAEFEIELSGGRIYYVDEMLFVDYDRVNSLREENPWIETAPLLSFPWPTAPFLSHLVQKLQKNEDTKLFAHLLRNSDIASLVTSTDETLNRLSYTALVPTDAALKKAFNVDNLTVMDKKSINDFLLEHLVAGYLFEKDLENGFNLLTLAGNILPIRITNDEIFLRGSKIIEPEQYVYNLGSIFIIDAPLTQIDVQSTEEMLISQQIEDVEIVPLAATNSESIDGSADNSDVVPVTEIGVVYEVRTEISYSRQINDGIIVPISKDIIERAKRVDNFVP